MTDTGTPELSLGDTIAAEVGDPQGPGESLRFSTTLAPSSFIGLSLKNGLLNLITLTLYRFWAKTEVRRRIWQGVRLNDDAFEYTGRGKELFIGFLLALVVLGVPFLAVVFAVQFLGPGWAILIILPLYVFVFWLWGFGVFTAYRYLASRTTWRGVRFQLKGSATNFGWKYLGVILLSGITLGWYAPAGERSLASSVWSALSFGDRRIRFRMDRAEREGVYGAFALGWFLTIIPYFVLIGVVVAISMVAQMGSGGAYAASPEPPVMHSVTSIFIVYGVTLAVAPLILLIWSPYHAAMLRSIAAGVGVDDATFKLEVKALSLWWLMVVSFFFLIITLGFAMPWVQARTARFLVERLRATGTAQLDQAAQAGVGPTTGEGLADAFGFSLV